MHHNSMDMYEGSKKREFGEEENKKQDDDDDGGGLVDVSPV